MMPAALGFDLDTATRAQLATVANPAGLPTAEKLRYFSRKRQLDYLDKIAIVVGHRDRVKAILEDLLARAGGEPDDEVHQQIKAAAIKLTGVLNTYKGYAKTDSKKFNETELVIGLRAPLAALKAAVPDPVAAEAHLTALAKARIQVGDALAKGEAGIRAFIKDASISYRGSLATGWRNENKSAAGVAQRINLITFDSDAFVDVPSDTWEAWNTCGVVLDREKEGKMDLGDMIKSARAKSAEGAPPAHRDACTRLLSQLEGVLRVEAQLRDAMQTVKGYKIKGGAPDFSFVLQSSKKTLRELAAGNLYPLDEVAKAGLPLTEAELDLVVESATIKVRMPERHINMSKPSVGKTYDTDIPDDPHVVARPTDALSVHTYFDGARAPLKHVDTVVRTLAAQANLITGKDVDLSLIKLE